MSQSYMEIQGVVKLFSQVIAPDVSRPEGEVDLILGI